MCDNLKTVSTVYDVLWSNESMAVLQFLHIPGTKRDRRAIGASDSVPLPLVVGPRPADAAAAVTWLSDQTSIVSHLYAAAF